jgi:hypothetical protein
MCDCVSSVVSSVIVDMFVQLTNGKVFCCGGSRFSLKTVHVIFLLQIIPHLHVFCLYFSGFYLVIPMVSGWVMLQTSHHPTVQRLIMHGALPVHHFNPLNTELNPICHLLALLEAHHIFHVSRIKVNCVH